MIDVSGRPEPQLRTLLATRIHHAKVVHSRLEYGGLFLLVHFGNAAHEHFDFLILEPFTCGHYFGAALFLARVAKALSDCDAAFHVEKVQKLEQVRLEELHVERGRVRLGCRRHNRAVHPLVANYFVEALVVAQLILREVLYYALPVGGVLFDGPKFGVHFVGLKAKTRVYDDHGD